MAGDIGDAVRQRLISASSNLRRADQCLDDEPDRARDLVRAALGYADIGLDEMCDSVAGIYLTVLQSDGLAVAASALAQISAIPMTLDVSPSRCDQSVEAAAYFLVAETLTIVGEQT